MSEQPTILKGDAFFKLRELQDASIDLVCTDPPYSSGGAFRGDRMLSTRDKYQASDVDTEHVGFMGDNRDQRSWTRWCVEWLAECLRVTKPGGVAVIFIDWRQLPSMTDAVQMAGWVWRGVAVWDKVVARPQMGRFRQQAEFIVWATNGPRPVNEGDVCLDGVFRVTTVPTADRVHATQKPVDLLEKLVQLAPLNGVVLDPFLGSGTTLVACERTGRKFIGCEIDPHWVGVSSTRASNVAPLFGTGAKTT